MARGLINTALRAAQIGRCGELLVQYLLLKGGIESAALTTDSGVDLVAYAPGCNVPLTIQVKSNLQPKPGGGKGPPTLDWWVAEKCPAQLIALADLSTEKVWLLSALELATNAQQHSNGRWHIYMHTETQNKTGGARANHVSRFDQYLIENRTPALFTQHSPPAVMIESPILKPVVQNPSV